jgi:hypothetical protein
MPSNDIKCVLAILDNLSVELSLRQKNADKVSHAIASKQGQSGWILYRKYHLPDYKDTMISGNQKTSIIAKHWKSLSKQEKAKWKYTATHSTECGNRWAMLM